MSGVQVFSSLTGETRYASELYPSPVRTFGEVPRLGVTPTVAGVAQASQEFGDGSGDVRYLRYTVNAGDAVTARERLKAGFPETGMLNPDSVLVMHSDVAITRLDLVAIGDTESGTLSAGELVVDAAGSTEAEYGTAMVTFEWDAADDVRAVVITISQPYSAAAAPATSANFVRAHIEGRSNA